MRGAAGGSRAARRGPVDNNRYCSCKLTRVRSEAADAGDAAVVGPTWPISLKSWETSTTPPSHRLIASASASIESMSARRTDHSISAGCTRAVLAEISGAGVVTEVVGGLVEEDDVRLGPGHVCEADPRLLPVREVPHLGGQVRT